MKSPFWVQLFCLVLFVTILCSLLGILSYQRITKPVRDEGRNNLYLLLANILEDADYPQAMQQFERYRAESPSLASEIWVITKMGNVLASNSENPLPKRWSEIPKPVLPHTITSLRHSLQLFPELVLLKLRAKTPTYVLIRPSHRRPLKTMAYFQMILLVSVIFATAIGGAGMTFLYLRKTSNEAKSVVTRLQKGDMKARFKIHRWDKAGGFKQHFNAMASEIELLIGRIQKIELARKNMLQELGHDLRTPLTSLTASFETLSSYNTQMSPEQQREFFSLIQIELDYFVRLLDDLFFIADIVEQDYGGNWHHIELNALVKEEFLSRCLAQTGVEWHLDLSNDSAMIRGDRFLLRRLLRNTFDNAGKYAHSEIRIRVRRNGDLAEIEIEDDGPGMTAAAIQNFGVRNKHRLARSGNLMDVSLGLGSVIIKTIVELHDALLKIESNNNALQGTRFTYTFPILNQHGVQS